ncbi:hypothetical protein PF011_g26110 [Phytophthora fragariae]|uniref:Uncharacterized protein n=1 Tax=Phytophthora fragariae TaxID=53985 RepID=A0A6A3HLF4_9STRA|nr:hypothetical protein PF011_g26110 [Phytophthora fragariae]
MGLLSCMFAIVASSSTTVEIMSRFVGSNTHIRCTSFHWSSVHSGGFSGNCP